MHLSTLNTAVLAMRVPYYFYFYFVVWYSHILKQDFSAPFSAKPRSVKKCFRISPGLLATKARLCHTRPYWCTKIFLSNNICSMVMIISGNIIQALANFVFSLHFQVSRSSLSSSYTYGLFLAISKGLLVDQPTGLAMVVAS